MSAFRLLDRYAKGEDIGEFLRFYGRLGFNVLRVWPYVPTPPWKPGWDAPSVGVVREFLAVCKRAGFYVELTLLTDEDPMRIRWAAGLMHELSADPPLNLVIEIGNEPTTNNKNIQTAALGPVMDQWGRLYSSGDYEQNGEKWFGSYFTIHTPRDGEWPRKTHDLLEQREGSGPDTGTQRAIRVPIVADEPIRPDDPNAGFNAQDFYAYAAGASLFGAGATFHSESGKFAELPSADEAPCAEAFARGLRVFPADAPLGAYDRIDEHGATLRTYTVGDYMERIRPTRRSAPTPGWVPLDEFGICWRRG